MNQEQTTLSSGYEASPAEVKNVIIEWAKAAEAFHYRYAKLTEVINALQVASRRNPSVNRTRLRQLMALRQQMSDTLMTLLLDMSGQKSERSAQPSKPGQLRSHAYLLDELNRQIDAELVNVTSAAQA